MRKKIFIIIQVVCLSVCAQSSKFSDVLSHYQNDSLKSQATRFLLDNMADHCSPEGTAMDEFAMTLSGMKGKNSMKKLSQTWEHTPRKTEVVMEQDSNVVDYTFLVDNIDDAFTVWKSAPWAKDISFEHFCEYVLPYRVKDERLCRGWRKELRDCYGSMIYGVDDMKEAFEILYDTIMNSVELSNPHCPYAMDVLTLNSIKKATCNQRCVLLTSVLRAFAIPAAIDVVPMWGNYSDKGHSWVSLVRENGDTFTVFENERTAKRFNKLDASRFKNRYKVSPQDKCPFDVLTEKKAAKIYRLQYRHINDCFGNPKSLQDPFAQDVSDCYGLTAQVHIGQNATKDMFLCAFRSGANWTPIAKIEEDGGKGIFRNVGNDIVYVVVKYDGKRLVAVGSPFLVKDNAVCKTFSPKAESTRDVTLLRKYPLCSYMTDLWGYMKGATFEGANNPNFHDPSILARISTMPFGETSLKVDNIGKFRYLRYKTSKTSRMALAELHFFTTDANGGFKELKGRTICEDMDSSKVHLVYDGDLSTGIGGKTTEYWVGLDLGEGNDCKVDSIAFAPTSDTNSVEAGHLYELHYFDRGWKLLGRKVSNGNSISFANVPSDAILLLKDRTKGKEERIFEYKDGRQIWY